MMWIQRLSSVLLLAVCVARCAAAPPTPSTRPSPVTACLFTHDGSALVVAHHTSVVVHSAADGSVLRTLPIDLPRINALSFAREGKLLAVAGGTPGRSGSIVLWDWKNDLFLARFGDFQDVVTAVDLSPDGRLLAASSADGSARVFRLGEDGLGVESTASLVGHTGPVLAIALGPGSKTAITGGADRSIKVWDVVDARLLRTLTNHTAAVSCLKVRPTSDPGDTTPRWSCASAGNDHTVRVWQPEIGRMVRIVRGHERPAFALAYARGGSVLISAGAEGVVRMIDGDSDLVISQWKAHDDWIYALATSPDGKRVATGDWSGRVRVWDVRQDQARPLW